MRAIALVLSLVSFVTSLISALGVVAQYMTPVHGSVLALLGLGLTGFWLSVANKH